MKRRHTVIAVLSAAAIVATLAPKSAAGAPASAAPLGTFACQRSHTVEAANPAAQVMRGVFAFPGFRPYVVARGANVNWRLDPYRHPSWVLWLHSLRWTGSLLTAYRATKNPVYRDRAIRIVQDWARDNPVRTWAPRVKEGIAHRVHSLLCLQDLVGAKPWLTQIIMRSAEFLRTHWSGYFNHGLDENIALLGIGCRLGRRDYAELARRRTAAMASVIVDSQGVTNEQSIGYQVYNYNLLGNVLTTFRRCGVTPPAILASRRPLMPNLLAHATKPSGHLAAIGDTFAMRTPILPGTLTQYPATLGTRGTPPGKRLAVFRAGYIFGRSAWRPFRSQSWYALRFGPGRIIHGHDDHMSLLWWTRGRDILVDSGHVGYESTAYRGFLKSAAAHNVATVPTSRFNSGAATKLTRLVQTPRFDAFELADRAYGMPRLRTVLMARGLDLAVVYDRIYAPSRQTYRQLWHLPPGLRVAVAGPATAVATPPSGDVKTVIMQVPFPHQGLARNSTTVVRGRTNPWQGWVSGQQSRRIAAPVVDMMRTGNALRQLTVIAVMRRAGTLSARAAARADGTQLVTLVIEGKHVRVVVSPGGFLSM